MANSRFFTRYQTALDRRLFRLERKYRAKIYKELQRQKDELRNTGTFTSRFEPIFRDLYGVDGLTVGSNQYNLLNGLKTSKSVSDFFSTAWRVWMEVFVQTRMAQKIVAIDTTTREAVQEVLRNNVGVPFNQIVDQLKMFDRQRAMRIARTEVAQMANESQRQAAVAWKEEVGELTMYKMWMHRGAKDPRAHHVALDGVAIPENEQFQIIDESGVEYADYPHAENLSARNVVNCSCTVTYVSYSYAKNNGMISTTSYPITQLPSEPQEPQQRVNFVESKNKADAERFLIENNLSGKVDYSKATLKQANEINEIIAKLDPKTPISEVVIGSTKMKNVAGYYDPRTDKIVMSRTLGKGSKSLNSFEPTDLIKKRNDLILKGRANVPDYDYQLDYLDFNIKRYSRASAGNGSLKDSFIHEFGHRVDKLNNLSTSTKTAIENASIDFLDSMSFSDRRKWVGSNVSVYARVNKKELFAELYTMKQTGQKIPKELDTIITNIIKNAK